jgi:hypothetical protein
MPEKPVARPEPVQTPERAPQSPAVAKAQAILGASVPRPTQEGGFKIRLDTPNGEL